MLKKLYSLPRAKKLLPFVRLSYEDPSEFIWSDNHNEAHTIVQGDGGEQGDPLMPSLFCLGLHDVLEGIGSTLREGEYLLAYLDDIYIIQVGTELVFCMML